MKQIELLIKNAHILTMDSDRPEIKSGAMAVDEGKIVAVGDTTIQNSFQAKETIDAEGKLLLPGFVNTHTHASMTIFRGFADDLPLHIWLNEHIFPAEAKYMNAETAQVGAQLAMLEMVQGGTTTFNDMYFFEEQIAEVADKFGMRAMLSEGVLNFPTPNCATPQEALAITKKLAEKYANNERIYTAVSAHAPYTCSDELMQEAKRTADELDTVFHIHLAETRWEYDKYTNEFGKTPTQYIYDLGLLDKNTLAAHCVHLSDSDIELFARRKANVAHNPECNMKLASGAAPIPKLLSAGVNVGLGTDGTASNNNLDMRQEMQTAALLHKLVSNDPTVADAKSMVEMATIGGAKALGLEKEIGSLEIGKWADFILIDFQRIHTTPSYNPYSQLVYAANSADITDVAVAGKFLYRNTNFTTLDPDELIAKAKEIASRIQTDH